MSNPSSSAARVALAALLGVASAAFATKALATWTPFFDFLPERGLPRPTIYYAFDVVVSVLLLTALGRTRWVELWRTVGLARAPDSVSLACAALFLPVAAVAYWRTGLAADLRVEQVVFTAAIAPPFEEVLYRGLAIGVLMKLAGWRFLPAALATSIVFGLAHFFQGEGWTTVLGVVTFTTIGGLWFGWIYVRTGFDLWPPIVLHAGMNLVWEVFGLGETAIGGWLGNGLRLAVIVASVWIVYAMTRNRGGRRAAVPETRD